MKILSKISKPTPAGWAWLGLVQYVVVADTLLILNKKPTMSDGFACAVKHPMRRWPVIISWALLTGHLFGPAVIPDDRLALLAIIDPLGTLCDHLFQR